jgi:inner membrane protein
VATLLTHALVGAALTPVGPRVVPRGRLILALVVVSVLPDLDVLSFALGVPYSHPLGHRGFSHSLLFASLIAYLAARFGFPSVPRPSRAWWRLFAVLVAAAASHGLLDALTDGGLGVGFLLPFSSERFFLPFRPLVVSPIGLHAFLSGSGWEVLRSEARYVWLPLAALGLATLAMRRVPRGTAWRQRAPQRRSGR